MLSTRAAVGDRRREGDDVARRRRSCGRSAASPSDNGLRVRLRHALRHRDRRAAVRRPACRSPTGRCRRSCSCRRRCTRSRRRASGSSTRPSPGCTSPPRGTGPTPCTSPGCRPCTSPTGRCPSACTALPSLHDVPFAFAGFEHAPVDGLHVPAAWHWSDAVHVTGFPPVHVPDWQVSVCVHAFPSLHDVPFAFAGFEHAPVAGLHVPAAWHWSDAVQRHRVAARARPRLAGVRLRAQAPVVARRPVRHRRVRARARRRIARPRRVALVRRRARHRVRRPCTCPPGRYPSACRRCRRCTTCRSPSPGSSTRPSPDCTSPPTWHWSDAVQVTGLPPVQTPAWQLDVCVQALPSLHDVPLALGGSEHDAGLRAARARFVARVAGRAVHRVRAGALLVLAGRRARARVLVVARGAVRLTGALAARHRDLRRRRTPETRQWPALPLKNCSLFAVHVARNRQCANGSRNVAWPLAFVVLLSARDPCFVGKRRHRLARHRRARAVDHGHHGRRADQDARATCSPARAVNGRCC